MNSHDNMCCFSLIIPVLYPAVSISCFLCMFAGTKLANNLPLFPYQLVVFAVRTKFLFNSPVFLRSVMGWTHSGKSATIRESNHGLGVCKEHYAPE